MYASHVKSHASSCRPTLVSPVSLDRVYLLLILTPLSEYLDAGVPSTECDSELGLVIRVANIFSKINILKADGGEYSVPNYFFAVGLKIKREAPDPRYISEYKNQLQVWNSPSLSFCA